MTPRTSTQKKPWLESRDISHLRYRLCGTSAADAAVPAPRMPRLRRAQTVLGDHCYYDGVRPSVRGGSAGKKVLTRPPATVFELHTYLLTVAPFLIHFVAGMRLIVPQDFVLPFLGEVL